MLSSLHSFTPPQSSEKPKSLPLINTYLFSHPSSLLLELCSNTRELHQFLSLITKRGLSIEPIIQSKLVALFSRFGSLKEASLVFSSIETKTEELYHSILNGHCHHSSLEEALCFFSLMRQAQVRPSAYNFSYLLRACGDNADLRRGREIHSQLISNGFGSHVYAMTAVANMYAKCSRIKDARKMFDRMPKRDLVAWNAVIAGYAQNGLSIDALEFVSRMQEDRMRPDPITLVSALPACADTKSLKVGKSIHGFAIRAGFEQLSGDAEEAMRLYKSMLAKGIKPTDASVLAALNACIELADLEEGRQIHELSLSIGLGSNVSVMNSLITMYSKCKRPDLAAKVFEGLRAKTRVSWNAMVLGYSQNKCADDALRLFSKMQSENIKPDSFTLVSVIPAVSDMSLLRRAKWIHGYAMRMCLDGDIFVATALVDMYAKCGGIALARKLFDLMVDRHVTTWNAMIDGYGTHGFAKEALELFKTMKRSSIQPNDVTFLCVLSACSHAGLVNEGKLHFESMKKDYMLGPAMDHYGTMVDLLGRAGRLDEAWNFIERMPLQPSISVYGAMLGACKIHKNVRLAEVAAERLFQLEPDEGGYHVLLANIYSSCSMWEEVARVRRLMEKQGLQKTPGWTSIELHSKVHKFYSGSTNHPQSMKIYARLKKLMEEIRDIGYVPDTESSHDVEDEVQVQLLASHSEKLAIAFGLISSRPGTMIQIKKNLRVCRDCHTATKFISQVTGREIIVRDMQRFHHFKDGRCSCGDYW
ncbi:uncharacterized protein A4U43_C08F1340 [Asparagus officinalis]|nr:uncharacterized protein A4U43_C08F1340 [Asparagus officinalis]